MLRLSKLNSNGFGLIETLISLLLLTIVLVAGMAFYFNGDEFMGLAMHKKMAMEMVNSRMEDLKSSGYSNLPPAGTPVVTNISIGGLTATQTVNVSLPSADYKQVTVRLDWTESGKVTTPQRIELTTFMSP